MKVLVKYLVVFLGMNFLASGVFAQINELTSAKVSANIVETGSMAKTINTDFGNVVIVLSAFVKTAPIGVRQTKGGIVLPVTSGTFTAAVYDYTGTSGTTYTISYPKSPIIIKSGYDELEVTDFTSDPAQNAGSELIAGVFVSISPANVTVNYN
jgi:hypothetical protein